MSRTDPLLDSLKGDRTGEAVNLAIDTFTPQPALETTPLDSEGRSDYRAIGAFLLLMGGLCALAVIAYGTETGMPLGTAILAAILLLTGIFAFAFAFLTLRKMPFVLGLLALAGTMLSVALGMALDMASGWPVYGPIVPSSDYASPEGILLFAAVFGGGSLFMALRMARSPDPFYGFS